MDSVLRPDRHRIDRQEVDRYGPGDHIPVAHTDGVDRLRVAALLLAALQACPRLSDSVLNTRGNAMHCDRDEGRPNQTSGAFPQAF